MNRRRMPHPLLYTYRRCPYAMRARMALLQAGRGFDAHEIVLRDKPADMLRVSPKGTVPVLVLLDGKVVDESLEIMRWAFEARDAEGWWERAQLDSAQAPSSRSTMVRSQSLDAYKYPDRPLRARVHHRNQGVACLLHRLD